MTFTQLIKSFGPDSDCNQIASSLQKLSEFNRKTYINKLFELVLQKVRTGGVYPL